MKVYIKFLILLFLKNLFFVTIIMLSLVFILNTLSELEFFSEYSVDLYFPIYISLLNSPSLLFEMFPFIFLISTQLFFINLFNNNEVEIFKTENEESFNKIAIETFNSQYHSIDVYRKYINKDFSFKP